MEKSNVLLKVENLRKTFGPTKAVSDISFELNKGEVLSLVGANGAGKSTLSKIVSGVYPPDSGSMQFNGETVNFSKYSTHLSKNLGIRVVHQELSLCKNLTVYENFYIENGENKKLNLKNWRKETRHMAIDVLNKVFPDNDIDVNARLDSLSIAQMQMVEIARVFVDANARLIILDEPTSSLPNKETRMLISYIRKSLKSGISYIFISHRLQEVLDISNYVFIMQNGCEKCKCRSDEITVDEMVARMSNITVSCPVENRNLDIDVNLEKYVKISNFDSKKLHNINLEMYGGEIIGISGLEGNGQKEILQQIFYSANCGNIQTRGKIAYVSGDRKKEGIFPLWNIWDNSSITEIAKGNLFRLFSKSAVSTKVNDWNQRLHTKCHNYKDTITTLSGGNQQKVLLARAMASDADIILLDDPSKGVDAQTKNEFYQIFRNAAESGKLVIWYSSDDTELNYCSKVLVMSGGTVVGSFKQNDFDCSKMISIAFNNVKKKSNAELVTRRRKNNNRLYLPALLSAVILYGVCGILSPSIFSMFGIELLAVGFTPFIFGALSQTFIIGLGHIDLGVGSFMGLVNVICATVLEKNTTLGIGVLLLLLVSYGCMGLLICWRKIPSIIVTLSMSFVWLGIAYVLQDVPGGTVPSGMINFFNFNHFVLQGVLVWLLVFIGIAILFYRTRTGTVLRGFGNNETSMNNSGWSSYRAYFLIYLAAGIFALFGGISQSAITQASDVNAMSTYTILTVAAVIIGGGYFNGGFVSHFGTVFGSIVLTMVSIILGLFRVSTDFTATIQGVVLILILSLRLLQKESIND